MDQNLGIISWSGRKRHLGGSGTCTKKEREICCSLRSSSRKAMRRQMTWQKPEQCWTKGFMAEARAETMQQEREEVYVALQYAASFHCLVEQWKDCEELKPQPKEKWVFVENKSDNMMH